MNIPKDWLPTPKSINALPKPIREYIHGIETLCDPQYLIQQLVLTKDAITKMESALLEKYESSDDEYDRMITRAVHKFQDKGKVGNLAEIKKEMGVNYGYSLILQCAQALGYRIEKYAPVINYHSRSGYTIEDIHYRAICDDSRVSSYWFKDDIGHEVALIVSENKKRIEARIGIAFISFRTTPDNSKGSYISDCAKKGVIEDIQKHGALISLSTLKGIVETLEPEQIK